MSDRLACKFRVTIGGRVYENGAESAAPGQPISLNITHRDQEASQLELLVFDNVTMGDVPFPEYNSIPNPRINENIPIEAWAGWDEEELVKVFEGILLKKSANMLQSQTRFVGTHESFKLRKRGKVHVLKNLTAREMIIRKAREEGIEVQFHPSAASDPALNTPVERFFQLGEPQWPLIRRWLVANGFIANTIKKNVIVIRRDKTGGRQFSFKRGDENIISLSISQEQKRDERSGRRKGHTHEHKPGRHWSREFKETDDGSRAVEPVRPPIGRDTKTKKVPFARFAQSGKAKRRKVEGDELSLTVRLQPEMRNEEIIQISGFGPQIDGQWQTSEVVHRLGYGPAQTEIKAWRPAQ
ncbi:MAG: hypothetical protein HY231_23860 [Acidobacteria bacterium]|nr:hypothetical protein [Acidobacteriota bacterium]